MKPEITSFPVMPESTSPFDKLPNLSIYQLSAILQEPPEIPLVKNTKKKYCLKR
jgi:hypothetical protein